MPGRTGKNLADRLENKAPVNDQEVKDYLRRTDPGTVKQKGETEKGTNRNRERILEHWGGSNKEGGR